MIESYEAHSFDAILSLILYIDGIKVLLLDWKFLVVNYSWSFGSNKFECKTSEYILASEIVPGETTALLTISLPHRTILSPSFSA